MKRLSRGKRLHLLKLTRYAAVVERLSRFAFQLDGHRHVDQYDRKGRPLTFIQWSAIMESDVDFSYRRVRETQLPGGGWVSTVWLGLDHGHGVGAPLIFESMVFGSRTNFEDLDCRRYATEEEARAGHAEFVAEWAHTEVITPESAPGIRGVTSTGFFVDDPLGEPNAKA